VRLRRLEEEFGDRVVVDWRSFLLRPQPQPRSLEDFRTYTRSWRRPAADEDAGTFRVWATDAGPPTHSVPPHLVAKAAATLGADAFERMHAALLAAYFADNRDITDPGTLQSIWAEVGLPGPEFDRIADPALLDRVIAEHNEAVQAGITGVPAAMLAGNDTPISGALPLASYRRWIERALGAAS